VLSTRFHLVYPCRLKERLGLSDLSCKQLLDHIFGFRSDFLTQISNIKIGSERFNSGFAHDGEDCSTVAQRRVVQATFNGDHCAQAAISAIKKDRKYARHNSLPDFLEQGITSIRLAYKLQIVQNWIKIAFDGIFYDSDLTT